MALLMVRTMSSLPKVDLALETLHMYVYICINKQICILYIYICAGTYVPALVYIHNEKLPARSGDVWGSQFLVVA